MPTYEQARAEIRHTVDRMMERFHPGLRDAGVTVDLLEAFASTDNNGDPRGAPIKHQGYAALAVVKIIGLKERVAGRPDAEIVVDGKAWDEMNEAERDALIDHELEHLDLQTDKDGLVKRDDIDRPLMRMRKHDHHYGWFNSIVRRHGAASQESKQYHKLVESYRQMWLPFEDNPDQTPVVNENAERAEAEDGVTLTFETDDKSVTISADDFAAHADAIAQAAGS